VILVNLSGRSRPVMALSSVVLPLPGGPISSVMVPGLTGGWGLEDHADVDHQI